MKVHAFVAWLTVTVGSSAEGLTHERCGSVYVSL